MNTYQIRNSEGVACGIIKGDTIAADSNGKFYMVMVKNIVGALFPITFAVIKEA